MMNEMISLFNFIDYFCYTQCIRVSKNGIFSEVGKQSLTIIACGMIAINGITQIWTNCKFSW